MPLISGKKGAKTSCTKIKNPCKFCLQQVTHKNGLQCQGACKKWAHYKCLNYTPGKISDIKAGIIKVTCPCPDCETTQVKEYLVKPPYTCSNQACPANRGPKCAAEDCPTNPKKKPDTSCANKSCSKEPVNCPAIECPQSHPRLLPARPPTPPRSGKKTPTPPRSAKGKSPPHSPCSPRTPKACTETPPVKKAPPCAKTARAERREKLMKKKPAASPSCSVLSSNSNCSPKGKTPKCSSSDSDMSKKTQAAMVQAVQEMCNTVGKLSVQLRELMCKMMQK